MLNSFCLDRSTAGEQTVALAGHLANVPENQRVMYVTHQTAITALTGRDVSSGAVFLFRSNTDGGAEAHGRFCFRLDESTQNNDFPRTVRPLHVPACSPA